ncbi:CapA family protein [Candidatus Saccharibacteria bacterium]|nr:CapA family protein [Candidatus Saccharibacteria bacterium]
MKRKIIIATLCFLVTAGLSFGAFKLNENGFFKKLFHKPGELILDESLDTLEQQEILEQFGETELWEDVTVKKIDSFVQKEDKNLFLRKILVPTAEFYSSVESITEQELAEWRATQNTNLINVSELGADKKLLKVGEDYFLDTFASGAVFEYLEVSIDSEEDVGKVENILRPLEIEKWTKNDVLSFTQTGVTAMSRNMNVAVREVGDGKEFSRNIRDYLGKSDLTHTSNESSFSDWASGTNICSDWRFVDTILDIGLDIVELTGNHNQDCGDQAALDTIAKYEELGIKTVGGGRNAEEAAKPLEIDEKGSEILMLAYNQSTGGATYDGTPGANQYYEEDARARIAEAKAQGKLVIVDVQYYECSMYVSEVEDTTCDAANSSAGDQVGMFRGLIDMGADIVVGTSAHQTQTFEKYGKGYIYYGLGNLFFDQAWWPGTTRSLGLTHYIKNGKLLQTRRFGTVYDFSYAPRLMSDEELALFVERLNNSRP